MYKPIQRSFFQQPTIQIARQLLGQYLVHELPTGMLVGRIVETEAYKGTDDRAAHSFTNRPTKRTAIMFGEPGFIYTYQMHTHTLLNIVTAPEGIPHAVLIRAVEPILGHDQIQANRGEHFKQIDWTNGPGKLTKAFEITMDYYGHDCMMSPLYIAEGSSVHKICESPRVGIPNTGEARDYPWRFYVEGNPFVSRFR